LLAIAGLVLVAVRPDVGADDGSADADDADDADDNGADVSGAEAGGADGNDDERGLRGRTGPFPLPLGGVPFGFNTLVPTLAPPPTTGPLIQMLAVISVADYRNLSGQPTRLLPQIPLRCCRIWQTWD